MARKPPRPASRQVSSSAPTVRKKKPRPNGDGVQLNTQLEKRLHAAVCSYGNNYELGRAAGVSADVLSRFTRRERNLRLDSAGKLAQALGLTLKEME